MSHTAVHIINHTHWDREWFLTSVYTTQWIPGLIDRLDQIVAENPDYRFFLDGQTLIIEDLLQIAPEYEAKLGALVAHGNLLIGPYYCQPDWKLTSGEALIRNLMLGLQDMKRHGGKSDAGWLVDTFGHISQAPQIHCLFGVETVYVWRGVPRLEPYFHWQGADGRQLFSINLFGGYRNLYGITHVPEVAVKRLQAEVSKLRSFYPTADIPLFDGYDLEYNPEDPLRFYEHRQAEIRPDLQLQETSPQDFALQISQKLEDLSIIHGELNSGKYGAIFPGTLSTRIYLKVLSRDCEHLLYQVCEPLGVLARLQGKPYPVEQYETWSRALLQNAVHDCICGVSIDQVHEKMELNYRQVFDSIQADIQESIAYILRDFALGTYAISTNPFPYEGWQVYRNHLYPVQTDGMGMWHVGEGIPVEKPEEAIERFTWQNDHYTAELQEDGTLKVGNAILGRITVYREEGDAYSDDRGALIGVCLPKTPFVIERKSNIHCVLRIPFSTSWGDIQISATLHLTFDQSPLIRWQVDLDTRGTDFRVDLLFEMACSGQVYAGMPFDVVQRPTADRDLLPRQLDGKMASVLLGQRELGVVSTFPFQEFVAISDGTSTTAILTKGLNSYDANDYGRVAITLRRSVEWLTRPDIENRVGDAGPFFYVPDARCERSITHELAVMFVNIGVNDPQFHALNSGFQNPPLLVESLGQGSRTQWLLLQENLPLSSLYMSNDRILARFYNPTAVASPLSRPYLETDVLGNLEGTVAVVPPKDILTVALNEPLPTIRTSPDHPVTSVNVPNWRVGSNQGLPDPKIIAQLKDKIAQLEEQIAGTIAALEQATGRERYLQQYRIYVLQRELVEYRLSARLSEVKLAMQGQLGHDYLYKLDEEIAAIGLHLNQLRIKRRIYDYIVQIV